MSLTEKRADWSGLRLHEHQSGNETCHIRHTRCEPEWRNRAWCGEDIQYRFAYGSIDHAAYSAMGNGRLVPCERCIQAATLALRTQYVATIPGSDVTKPPIQKTLVPGYTNIFSDD